MQTACKQQEGWRRNMEKSKGKRQADALLGGESYFLLINSQKQVLHMYKKSSTFARQFAIEVIKIIYK